VKRDTIKATLDLAKYKTTKTQGIQQTLNQTTEKQVGPETLQTMLRNLEQYGFIK